MKALQYVLIQMQTKQLKPQQTEADFLESRIYHFLGWGGSHKSLKRVPDQIWLDGWSTFISNWSGRTQVIACISS